MRAGEVYAKALVLVWQLAVCAWRVRGSRTPGARTNRVSTQEVQKRPFVACGGGEEGDVCRFTVWQRT